MKISSFTRVVGAGLGGATLAGANVALGGLNPWLGAAGSVGTGIGLAAWTQAGEAALPAMAVGGIQAACGAYGGPQMALPLAAAGGAVRAYLSLRDEFKSSPPARLPRPLSSWPATVCWERDWPRARAPWPSPMAFPAW